MELFINLVLFFMLVATAIAILRMRHLFAVVMLSGVFSLLSALLFVALDAVDVAFTEAAVGAGISTVLLLGTMALTARNEKMPREFSIVPLLVVMATGAVLIYGTLDMPSFGSPTSPAQTHLAEKFLTQSPSEVGIPNVVSAILASYRGYDTLGETVVVFTACIGVLMLIGSFARRRRKNDGGAE
jgi:multicomponent Na+:H+ antiporter subunit B